METNLETSRTWRDILAALERDPIQSVASQFGVSAGAIAAAIRRTGATRQAVVPPEQAADVAASRAEAAADEAPTEVSPARTRAPAKTPAPARTSRIDNFRHLLGQQSDASVAKLAGVGREAVQAYRTRQGIPAARPKRVAEPAPEAVARDAEATATARPRVGGKRSPLDQHVALLGTMPDSDLARQLGISPAAVFQYRRRRGIAPFVAEPTPAPSKPAPEPAAPPVREPAPEKPARPRAAAGSAHGWTVVVRDGESERSYVVIGADIADAAARAVAAIPRGTVLSIVRYLDALV